MKKQIILSLAVFGISSLLISLGVYIFIPLCMQKWSLLFGEAYLFCFYIPFALILAAALVLYRLERTE